MSRIGQNPFKWIEIGDIPKKITIVTVVYLPELSGFWKKNLDVLRKFFNSLSTNTIPEFDLMVLDNGSCKDVKQFLQKKQSEDKIQFLSFSAYNLRKLGAMNYLFASAPGEIISFVDSDVYFFKGWLNESIKILDEFPKTGMVSALPTIDKTKDFYDSTYKAIEKHNNIHIQRGNDLIPSNYINAHRQSIGKTDFEYSKGIMDRMDVKISRNGINAFVCAQDFQFTTRKSIINKVLPLEVRNNNEYYDPIYSPIFEAKVDELGYWRLSTEKYLIHHMGNDLTEFEKEISMLESVHLSKGFTNNNVKLKKSYTLKRRVIEHPIIRRILKKIYSRIYNWLYRI